MRHRWGILVSGLLLAMTGGQSACGLTVSDIVNQVSELQYRHYLDNRLYAHNGDNRGLAGPQHDPCRNNIVADFASFGLPTTLEVYPNTSALAGSTNVVATKLGKVRPQDIWIVSAHYDSRENPGANDNATGVASMLEVARVLARYDFEATIRFIAFDSEEIDRSGSRAYVPAHQNDRILGVVNYDMIGYNPGNLNEVHITHRIYSPLMDQMAAMVPLYGQGLIPRAHIQYIGVDSDAFATYGFEAFNLSERFPANPHYHEPTDSVDTPGYIDYTFATKITRCVVGFVATKAVLISSGDTVAPTVQTVVPARGAALTNALSSVAVTFSEPVTGVTAASLKVNGSPATGVTGSGAGPYTFSGYAAPADGTVTVALAAGSIADAAGNAFAGDTWTYTKNTVLPDTVPPTRVGDLKGRPSTRSGAVDLTWTAPADTTEPGGTLQACTRYELRYSSSPILYNDGGATWNAATPVAGLPAPKAPGSVESFTVTGLTGNRTYYFALKAFDAAGNASEVSNSAQATASVIGDRILQAGLDGYSDTDDSYIAQGTSAKYGKSDGMTVRGYSNLNNSGRCILRFDLTGIPAGSQPILAELYVYSYDAAVTTGTAGFYGAYALTRTWTENQVNWTKASNGRNWTTPGGDFVVSPDAMAAKQGTAGVWYRFDVTSRVQAWLAGGGNNYGWIIKCTDEALPNQDRFRTSETADRSLRPYLRITDLPQSVTYHTNAEGGVDVAGR